MGPMLRIVGVQKAESPAREFVLLQNQGSMRVTLRGHLVISDESLSSGSLTNAAHCFADDVHIAPGLFVILFSGDGEPRWAKTKDGTHVYYAYMGRSHPVWNQTPSTLHVLSVQHSYIERTEPALLLK